MSAALETYTAANLGLAWDCVLVCDGGDYWQARRDGVVVALVRIGTTLPLLTHEPSYDRFRAAAKAAGARSAINVYAQQHEARWVDAFGGRSGKITMPVHLPQRAEPLWYHEQCRGRHPLSEIAACTG